MNNISFLRAFLPFKIKKYIIYVYPPFEDYFHKYPILLDYREIDLSWIDFRSENEDSVEIDPT